MKYIKRILSFVVVLAFFSSCLKNEICSPVEIELQAGIYTRNDTNAIVLIPIKTDIDSIYGITNEDHNLLLNATQIDNISFPLNDATTESSFVLTIGGIKDTLRFIYEKQLLFKSIKCGVSYTCTITDYEYSTNGLQEIILINPEIDVASAENIQLVF